MAGHRCCRPHLRQQGVRGPRDSSGADSSLRRQRASRHRGHTTIRGKAQPLQRPGRTAVARGGDEEDVGGSSSVNGILQSLAVAAAAPARGGRWAGQEHARRLLTIAASGCLMPGG